MKSKSPVRFLVGGLVLVALLSLLLTACATSSTPQSPVPPPTSAPVPAKPGAPPAPAPVPSAPQPAPLTGGMKLTVTEPADNIIIDGDRIEIKGTTSPDAVVSANNEFATADSQGNFAITIVLDEGPNIIEVFASDASGNQANVTLTVSYVKGG